MSKNEEAYLSDDDSISLTKHERSLNRILKAIEKIPWDEKDLEAQSLRLEAVVLLIQARHAVGDYLDYLGIDG